MRTICIIGETPRSDITYLARKAGMKMVLVNHREKPLILNTLTSSIASTSSQNLRDRLIDLSEKVDVVVQVNENPETIRLLKTVGSRLWPVPCFLILMPTISALKKRSKDFFYSIDIPTPADNLISLRISSSFRVRAVAQSIIHDEGMKGLDP